MPSDLDLLSNVVERLGRENLRLKRIGMSMLVLIGAALLMGQSRSTKTVEAGTFVLKGSYGSIKAKMDTKNGSTEFLFYNAAAQPRVAIKSDEEGEGLEMRDDSGELLATVSVALRSTIWQDKLHGSRRRSHRRTQNTHPQVCGSVGKKLLHCNEIA